MFFTRRTTATAKMDHRQSVGPRLESLEPRRMLDAAAVDAVDPTPAEFVQNVGQWDADVHYIYRTGSTAVAATAEGLSFVGLGADDAPAETVDIRFDGAEAVAPTGLDIQPGRFNYHVGSDASRWVDGARAFGTLAYEGLYDGIDLLVSGQPATLKYEYHLDAGADASQIALRFDGAEDVYLDESGALHVDLGDGELIDDAPIAYQDINGVRVAVDSAFVIADDGAVSFALGDVDPTAELVIDPILAWGSYMGLDNVDATLAITRDAGNALYAVGSTLSIGWVTGGWDVIYGGNGDGFVIKYTRKTVRLWTTYVGGSQADEATGVTVSPGGRVYVVGWTESAGWTSGTAIDQTYNGARDAFVLRMRQTGKFVWSGYLGGTGLDEATGVDASINEAVHVSGLTNSAGWITKGPDTTYGGNQDGFYARLWIDGQTLRGSYLGGTQADSALSVVADNRLPGNDILVCGNTQSAGWTLRGVDLTLSGTQDGFLAKFASGGRLIWSRYLGRTGVEEANSVTVGINNRIYVGGTTTSTPWPAGGWNTTYNGNTDGYVFAMRTTGAHMWSTYVGGTNLDDVQGLTTDANGNVYAAGYTSSAGWVSGGWATVFSGGTFDGFIVRFSANGVYGWSSYLGGLGADQAFGVAADRFVGAHVVGQTGSVGWIGGGWDNTLGSANTGGLDGFTLWAKG